MRGLITTLALCLLLAGAVHGTQHAAHFDHHEDGHESHYAEDDCLAIVLGADIIAEGDTLVAPWPFGIFTALQAAPVCGRIIAGFHARAPPFPV